MKGEIGAKWLITMILIIAFFLIAYVMVNGVLKGVSLG
jgi:hypothetical protein